MGSFSGVIAELNPGFWEAAQKLGVKREPAADGGSHVLIACAWDYEGVQQHGEALSREAATKTIAYLIQTTVDAHVVWAYEGGKRVRELAYDREGEGWVKVEGTPQPWEPTYLFEMFDDEGDVKLLEAARAKNDPMLVLEHLRPTSGFHLDRLCRSFGLKLAEPGGRWKKPSIFSRLFG